MSELSEPKITFNRLFPEKDYLEPASMRRDWMDEFHNKFIYRCVPMTIANSSGWVLKCPYELEATWNGGSSIYDVTVKCSENDVSQFLHAYSHFGSGILTFPVNYIIRTTEGWGVYVRGLPNSFKEGIIPLDAFVETDWVPFTFTMSWKFTKPGTVKFLKDEPYCFISMVYYKETPTIIAEIQDLEDTDDYFKDDYAKWSTLRRDFNRRLQLGEKKISKQASQKFYAHGKSPGAIVAPDHHISKLKMKDPIIKDTKI